MSFLEPSHNDDLAFGVLKFGYGQPSQKLAQESVMFGYFKEWGELPHYSAFDLI